MNRVAVAVLLLAMLGVPMVPGCGDSPPEALSIPEIPAPDNEEGTVKEDEFWRTWLRNIEPASRQKQAKPK